MHRTNYSRYFPALLLLLPVTAPSQNLVQELIPLSSQAQFADASLNEQLMLVPANLNITTVKLYRRGDGEWVLHVLGRSGDQVWFITYKLNSTQKELMQRRLDHIKKEEEEGRSPSFNEPLVKLDAPDEQELMKPWTIQLTDNTRLNGRITSGTADTLVVVTVSDIRMEIPGDRVVSVDRPPGEFTEKGEFQLYDPSRLRLFFGPTGRTLRQGEFNFSDYWIFFPSVSAGITDFLTVGGGISIVPGASTQVFYFAPKLRLAHTDNVDFALGWFWIGVFGEEQISSGYASVTVGGPFAGLTMGVAFPTSAEFNLESPGILLGGEVRLSSGAKFVTENWLITGGDSFLGLSAGFRFHGEKLAVSLGLFTSPEVINEAGGFPFFPWLDFSVGFGK